MTPGAAIISAMGFKHPDITLTWVVREKEFAVAMLPYLSHGNTKIHIYVSSVKTEVDVECVAEKVSARDDGITVHAGRPLLSKTGFDDSSEGNDHFDVGVKKLEIGHPDIRTPENLTVIKLPAATLMMTQPNDVMKSFVILKLYLKQKMNESDAMTDKHMKPLLYENIVDSLRRNQIFSAEDRKTISLLIEYVPDALYKAYIPTTVRSGCEKTGIYPLDMNVMLGHWPAYLLIENERKVELHQAFDLLADDLRMNDHGYLTEEELYYRLNAFVTPEEFSVNMGTHNRKSLNEKPLPPTTAYVWL